MGSRTLHVLYIQLRCITYIKSSVPFFVHSIMGVHVDRLRERALEHAEEKKAAASAESQGVCPFSAHKTEDNKSIYETLMSDDRVSKDLSANIIMALFRTGIDSVSLRLLMAMLFVSSSFSSFRLGPSLGLLFSSHILSPRFSY